MRKHILPLTILVVAMVLATAASFPKGESTSVKCMVQLTNYHGEGAYMVISLMNPKGEYEKTLYVMGQDDEWYPDIMEWWGFQKKVKEDIDGISGATISGGERMLCAIEVENKKIDAGYTLRFETAVEEQKYHVKDLEVPLTSDNISGKYDGSGYIRYIRMIPM